MFSFINTTKQNPLSKEEDFVFMKNKILGTKYDLSLHFVGPKKALDINKKYRKGNYVPNVLSFPIEKNVGEIFICLEKAKGESSKFNMTKKDYIKYLFIHGLLHLQGLDHGEKMEKLENKYKKLFSITD